MQDFGPSAPHGLSPRNGEEWMGPTSSRDAYVKFEFPLSL